MPRALDPVNPRSARRAVSSLSAALSALLGTTLTLRALEPREVPVNRVNRMLCRSNNRLGG